MARRFNTKKFKKTVAVIGEGITEHIYFTQLRKHENIVFSLKPELPKHSSIKSIVDKAVELINREFDHVFCLFDLDEINRDVAIREEYNRLKREHHGNNITFIENNPCMEFWFLLHFIQTTREFDNYRQLETELKKHIPDYEKTRKYLVTKDIYALLKENQNKAKQNAQRGIDTGTGNFSKSEVHFILDHLKID